MDTLCRQGLQSNVLESMATASAGQCGYHVVPLQEILMSKRSKYHDLLGATVTAEIAQAVQTDALKQVS